MQDKRYQLIYERLSSLTLEELLRIRNYSYLLCYDKFNYDEENKKFCPLAIAHNLHNTIENPTNDTVTIELSKKYQPVNILKGLEGEFYTNNRAEDLAKVLAEIYEKKLIESLFK